MLKNIQTDRISNAEVLHRINENRTFWKTIAKRRDALIGYIMRHDEIFKTIIQGTFEGRNTEEGEGRNT